MVYHAVMSTDILQAHIRLKKADKERIEALGRWWRIKSLNAVVLEAIKMQHELESDLRKSK
jgi:hypothetical protein